MNIQRKFLNVAIIAIIMLSIISPLKSNAQDVNDSKGSSSELDKIASKYDYNETNGYHILTQEEMRMLSEKTVSLTPHYSNVSITTYYDDGYIWGDIPYYTVGNEIIFCIEPGMETTSVANETSESGNNYSSLASNVKMSITRDISYGTKLYNTSHNEDYLWATQVLVWDDIYPNRTNLSNNSSIKGEMDEIQNKVSKHDIVPSFMVKAGSGNMPVVELNWNNTSNQYEIILTDTNEVWDDKYASYGNFGDYTLSNPNGANNVKVATTNHNASEYTYTGTYKPFGYNSQKFYDGGQDLINVGADPVKAVMQFKIIPATGNIIINKTGEVFDNSTEAYVTLPGTRFKVTNKDTLESYDVETDMDGKIELSNVIKGNYEYCEISAPTGYVADEECHDFIVNPSETTVINIENNVIRGSAHLQKIADYSINSNEKDVSLEGVKFEVTGNGYDEIFETDSNGEITIPNLKYGDYHIEEIETVEGYYLNGYSEDFTIDENNQVVELNNGKPILNNAIKGGFRLSKYGEDEINNSELQTLQGVEFKVTGITNPEFSKIYTTNRLGEIETSQEELVYGKYHIEEIKTQSHYYNEHYSEDFEITSNGQMVDINDANPIINHLIKGKIILHKVVDSPINGDDTLINGQGVEFSLTRDNEIAGTKGSKDIFDIPIDTLVTNENGEASSDWLLAGTYFIQETKTIEGYALDDTVYTVNINQDTAINNNMTYDLGDITNDINNGYIDLHKVLDSNGDISDLSNVAFAIYSDLNANQIIDKNESNPIEIITTDENGYAISRRLKAGSYIIKEINAPENVIMSNEQYLIQIKDENEIVHLNNGKDIINNEITNKIIIDKLDIDSKEFVEGAHLQIIDKESNEIVDEWDTNSKSHEITLPYGEYKLIETIIPYGYEKVEEEIEFTIDTDEQIKHIVLNNKQVIDVAITGYNTSPIIIFILMSIGVFVSGYIIKKLL